MQSGGVRVGDTVGSWPYKEAQGQEKEEDADCSFTLNEEAYLKIRRKRN